MIDVPLRQIQALFARAKKRVIIISAFVGSEALDLLLEAAGQVSERSVYVRWDMHDIASGASDWQSWDVARRHNAPMFACPGLHAKAYISDNKALIGSANATTPGLSGPPNGNLELLVLEDVEIDSIKQLVRRVKEISSPASPLGEDVAIQDSLASDAGHSDNLPFWIPNSDPARFLKAMAGEIPHDDESGQDRDALQLSDNAAGRAEIRKAAFNATVFRIVRTAFESRVSPMGISEVRSLLSSQASPAIERLPAEAMERLCQWLGEYGENTTMVPATATTPTRLTPGKLLMSESRSEGTLDS
ncbi:MAG: hypothetical protein F4Z71_13790 [Gammaproteobacteria bacterium]|nr:hypothetical protein [Gammaproteobacteria bacterium]MYE28391.1 hypothetical protein [Gammaproteobacteria bacterium]